jgi:hypothetical protein
MKRRNSRLVCLVIALLFFFIVSFVHFAHTEKGPWSDIRCPACQLQFSVLSGALVIFLLLSLLIMQLFFGPNPRPEYESQFASRISSRAPPGI